MDSSEQQEPLATSSQPAPVTSARRQASPWTTAFVVLISALVGFGLIAPFIGLGVAYPFYPGKAFDYINDVAAPDGKEYMKTIMWIVQAFTTFVGLCLIPGVFWSILRHRPVFARLRENPTHLSNFLLTIGIALSFMVIGSVFVEWNSNIDLPDGPFENMVRMIEDKAMEMTKFMTSFTSFGEYLGGMFVIAILAGFCEEYVFRGLIQPEMHKATGNIHFAIWITAIFFSALHLQFYGFVPRVLLGALFGYLYYWSGNLWIAMFAHFLNNFLGVTLIYAGVSDLPGAAIDDTTAMPWWAVAIALVIFCFLIYRFQTNFKPKTTTTDQQS